MTQFPALETERLILRQPNLDDSADVLDLYSRPEVTRQSEVVTLACLEQARGVVQMFESELEKDLGVRWAISERESRRIIGMCGVGWYRHNGSALLSYDLNPRYWHRGLMSEALRAVVAHVFGSTGTNRMTATTLVDNDASIRLLARLGFQEEGILRDWAFWKGQFRNLRCFSLLRGDLSAAALSCETLQGVGLRPVLVQRA
jgi:[ribosomal protein S5]-alanine N-acetyltransferase